jgi:hypothetical protein
MTVARTRLTVLFVLFGLVVSACNSQPAAPPTISDPMISDPTPQEPGKEVGISVDVSSAGGVTLTYTWNADGGEIVRGQGSPAITYRVPEEPGTYNVRVKVEWDGQSVEKVTTIEVKTKVTETAPPPTDNPTPKSSTSTPASEPTNTSKPTSETSTPSIATKVTETSTAPNINTIAGNWTGIEGYEDDHFQTRVNLSIERDCTIGSMCGRVTYPEIPCSGDLSLVKIEGQTFVFAEDMDPSCSGPDGGLNYVRLLENGNLALNYRFPNGEAGASGILHRQ